MAVVSAAGANGLDGGWAVLAGNDPVTSTGLQLFIEEDNLADAERVHTTERVAYLVFAASGGPTITSTPVTSATEDAAYSYDVQATDPDVGRHADLLAGHRPHRHDHQRHDRAHRLDADQCPSRARMR